MNTSFEGLGCVNKCDNQMKDMTEFEYFIRTEELTDKRQKGE